MILDSEEQRKMLLEFIKVANIPGTVLDVTYNLKQAVIAASIDENTTPE